MTLFGYIFLVCSSLHAFQRCNTQIMLSYLKITLLKQSSLVQFSKNIVLKLCSVQLMFCQIDVCAV